KLASEYLVQEFAAAFGMRSTIYRCGVIAGPGQFGKVDQGVFTMWVANHYFHKSLDYTGFGGAGKQVRDLLHPLDLFDLIAKHLSMVDQPPGHAYNVGGSSESSISLVELTALCRKIVGTTVPIRKRAETAAADIPLNISDIGRITSHLGWRPVRG